MPKGKSSRPNTKRATAVDPPRNCGVCPRLQKFLCGHRESEPDWHNAPVESFGDRKGAVLVVGLAPGLRGANRTGRPFTGDFAGDLLYATLGSFGFAQGEYRARPDDGLTLHDCLITNAVRCVPPQNKPLPIEIRTCQSFLAATIEAMPKLRAIVSLGRIAHDSILRTRGLRLAAFPFKHGARHEIGGSDRPLALFDSYHCSRYNTNTGVLTPEMFESVFREVAAAIR